MKSKSNSLNSLIEFFPEEENNQTHQEKIITELINMSYKIKKLSQTLFYKQHLDIFISLRPWFSLNTTASEVVFCITNNILCQPKCGCGQIKQWKYSKYNKFCSYKCDFQKQQIVNKRKQTLYKIYGNENYVNVEKCKQTCLEKYGVEYVFQQPEIIVKIQNNCKMTNLKKYGNEYIIASEHSKEKAKLTKLEKYGDKNYNNPDKHKQTCLLKFGESSFSKTEEYNVKCKLTNNIRFGVDHTSQLSEFHEKQQKYRWKDYILPSGKIIKVQGYEPKLLDILLDFYHEDEIITQRKDIPAIWYFTEDGKKHRYFADFYIPSENLILEVKSTYTYKKYKDVNILKEQATKESGYNYKSLIL